MYLYCSTNLLLCTAGHSPEESLVFHVSALSWPIFYYIFQYFILSGPHWSQGVSENFACILTFIYLFRIAKEFCHLRGSETGQFRIQYLGKRVLTPLEGRTLATASAQFRVWNIKSFSTYSDESFPKVFIGYALHWAVMGYGKVLCEKGFLKLKLLWAKK